MYIRIVLLTALIHSCALPVAAQDDIRPKSGKNIFELLFGPGSVEPPPKAPRVKPVPRRVEPRTSERPAIPRPVLAVKGAALTEQDIAEVRAQLRECADREDGKQPSFVCHVEQGSMALDFTITHGCTWSDACVRIAIMQNWCDHKKGAWHLRESGWRCEE